jgi:hypothetical protein
VFDQYLRTNKLPILEYKITDKKLFYRWANSIEGFNMPVKVDYGGEVWLTPSREWQEKDVVAEKLKVDPNFYVEQRLVSQL